MKDGCVIVYANNNYILAALCKYLLPYNALPDVKLFLVVVPNKS